MSARTVAIRLAVAQAGARGLAHVAAQQDSGSWISRCGRQVRGRDIRTVEGTAAGAHADMLGERLCPDCRDLALAHGDTLAAGVEALLTLGATVGTAPDVQLLDVAVADLPDVEPRGEAAALAGLAHSIRTHGLQQPIVLRRTEAGLAVVAGARRIAAARAAGLASMPALVRDVSRERAAIATLVENLHRTDLDPIAQALAYREAIALLGITQAALADELGISAPQVSNALRLLTLPEAIRDQVSAGALSAAHGRALLRVTDPTAQAALAAQIVEEGLSSRSVEESTRQPAAPHRLRPSSSEHDRPLDAIAAALAVRFTTTVRVTALAEGARITLDVPDQDLARVLEQLGLDVARADAA